MTAPTPDAARIEWLTLLCLALRRTSNFYRGSYDVETTAWWVDRTRTGPETHLFIWEVPGNAYYTARLEITTDAAGIPIETPELRAALEAVLAYRPVRVPEPQEAPHP